MEGNRMKIRQEAPGEVLGIAQMLEQLHQRLDSIEARIVFMESRLGEKGAGESKTNVAVSAKNAQVGIGAFAGIHVSGSNAPASVVVASKEMLLSSTDEQIVNLVGTRGVVCADDVQAHFKYKGKNAASARLNRLASLGVFEKQQAGRRVYYKLRI